ncbi:SRPBCC family protein [Fulvivirgaceae bacterium BMA12]|uniref:SRPBCC family protein n=1 Tax=Agaribacillus aureus TaxID=3051825 RepID=A0ABT8LGL3_9BACT|nr:SRPBCC family protein [Fulvivirgaceae bacterium BMA12]
MPIIELTTQINAPLERCFDLSRSIDLHKISTAQTKEEAIDGVTAGLIGLNEYVTWRAKHFGITQRLTTRITEFKRPAYFVDEMEKGAFKRFRHEHIFETHHSGTKMIDKFDYDAPLGVLGKLANFLFLEKYMTTLLEERNSVIKDFAETDKWKKLLSI